MPIKINSHSKNQLEPTAIYPLNTDIALKIPPLLRMSPNTYSLTTVSARPDKRSINATFANKEKKLIKPFPFFPSLHLPHTSTTTFEQILSTITTIRYQLVKHEHSIQVLCGTWEDLKQIAQLVYQRTTYFPLLVETERQFLLTQNWRYFQTFDEKLHAQPNAFDDSPIPGLVETLYPTLQGARMHNPLIESELREKIIASHELFLPYTDVPHAQHVQMEILLENFMLVNHIPKPLNTGTIFSRPTWTHAQRTYANQQFTQTPFLPTEGKCTCCAPTTIFHASLHEGSTLVTRVTQDGVYIHTQDSVRSEEYHATHEGKEKRIARKKEFGLSTYPIGPLFRGETLALPLHEARNEIKQGTLSAQPNWEHAYWKCTHHAFILERFARELKTREQAHEIKQNTLTQPYLTQYQLAYTNQIQKDPLVQLHTHAARKTREWTLNIGNHLTFGNTSWRTPTFAALLEKATLNG